MKPNDKAFRCINNKGFQVTFNNGWTVSVMFGKGNYCENRDNGSIPFPHEVGLSVDSDTAEVLIFKGRHELGRERGWQTAAEVAEILTTVEARCHCGGDFKGSDHCPECGCEEHQRTCDHVIPPDTA